jgi:hypothetical protein
VWHRSSCLCDICSLVWSVFYVGLPTLDDLWGCLCDTDVCACRLCWRHDCMGGYGQRIWILSVWFCRELWNTLCGLKCADSLEFDILFW